MAFCLHRKRYFYPSTTIFTLIVIKRSTRSTCAIRQCHFYVLAFYFSTATVFYFVFVLPEVDFMDHMLLQTWLVLLWGQLVYRLNHRWRMQFFAFCCNAFFTIHKHCNYTTHCWKLSWKISCHLAEIYTFRSHGSAPNNVCYNRAISGYRAEDLNSSENFYVSSWLTPSKIRIRSFIAPSPICVYFM